MRKLYISHPREVNSPTFKKLSVGDSIAHHLHMYLQIHSRQKTYTERTVLLKHLKIARQI